VVENIQDRELELPSMAFAISGSQTEFTAAKSILIER
jgi:hypothetical protein